MRGLAWLRTCGLALAVTAAACGGGNKDTVTPKAADAVRPIDDDPIALLPSGPMVLAKVDAKAMFASGSVGGQLGQIAERLLPIGDEAGFKASRDLETTYVAGYSLTGADVAAVLRGAFDEDRIKQVAANHTATKGGGALVSSEYGGRALYTVNNVGFTVLSKRTVLAGTETMIRRAIDRIKDGTAVRSQPKWMLDTVDTPNTAFAAAVDLATQSIGSASIGMVPLPWVRGLKAARVIGNFHDPGLNIAGTLTYPDGNAAQAASDDLKRTAGMANLLAVIGAPQLKNLDVKPNNADVQVSFAVDDAALRMFAGMVANYLPAR
jgi:hypothetical protein